MSAIAFLAGLGAGAVRSERVERELATRDAEEARRQKLFDDQQADRAKMLRDEQELRDAAAPVQVVEMPQQGPTLPDEAPLPNIFNAGPRAFAERGVAEAAAASENTPQAVRQRIVTKLSNQGKPVQADAVRGAGIQADAAEANLKQFTENAIKEGTLEFLGRAMAGDSPDAVKEAFNKNGKVKLKDVKIEPFEFDHPTLGKQRSAKITGTLEDGTPVDVPDAFQASFGLFSAAKRFELLGQWNREKRIADDREADNKRQDARDAENARHNRAVEARMSAGRGGAGGAGGAAPEMATPDSTFDSKTAADIAKDIVKNEAAEAAKAGTPMSAADIARRTNEIVASQRQEHTNRFIEGTVSRELRIAQQSPDAYAAAYAKAAKLMPPARLKALGFEPPAAPAAPAAPAQVTPAAIAAAAPAAPTSPAPVVPQQPAAMAIPPQHAQVLDPMNEQLAAAAAALKAAASSGDQRSVTLYGQQLEQLRAKRNAEALRRLGPGVAETYLSTLPV